MTEKLVVFRLGTQNPNAKRCIRKGFLHDSDELNDILGHR